MKQSVQPKNSLQLATLCYVRNEGKTLMLHKNKIKNSLHFGKFNGLGGKIEKGESALEGVKREVLEESGLRISKPFFHGFLSFPNFTPKCDWFVYVYSATLFKGRLRNPSEGSLHWIPDDELLTLNLWKGDKHFIPLVLAKKTFFATFDYTSEGTNASQIICA